MATLNMSCQAKCKHSHWSWKHLLEFIEHVLTKSWTNNLVYMCNLFFRTKWFAWLK